MLIIAALYWELVCANTSLNILYTGTHSNHTSALRQVLSQSPLTDEEICGWEMSPQPAQLGSDRAGLQSGNPLSQPMSCP